VQHSARPLIMKTDWTAKSINTDSVKGFLQ